MPRCSAADCDFAAPARRAERAWHVKGRPGATVRRERTRRAPNGWFLTRHRPGVTPPRWAEFILPKKGPKTREARIRALREAPDAVLDAKRESDKFSAESWEDKGVADEVATQLDAIYHNVIVPSAMFFGIPPLVQYANLFSKGVGHVAGPGKYEVSIKNDTLYMKRAA